MEINSLNKLDLEKYIQIKIQAYNMSDALTKEKIIEMASKYEINNPEERLIYISTLLYPNDQEFIQLFNNKKETPEIAKIPKAILETKIYEYYRYDLPKLLQQNESLRQYSNYKTKFEDDPTSEEIITSRFK